MDSWEQMPMFTQNQNQNQNIAVTAISIAALFIETQHWKQPKCVKTEGWINELQSIHTQHFLKKWTIDTYNNMATSQKKKVMMNERSQTERFPFYEVQVDRLTHGNRKQTVVTSGERGRKDGLERNRRTSWAMEIFYTSICVMIICVHVCYQKSINLRT